MMFESWNNMGLSLAILFFSSAFYTAFGFGMGLLATGLLALVIPDIRQVVVIILLVSLPIELFIAQKNFAKISWQPVLVISAGCVVGAFLGSWHLIVSRTAILHQVLAGLLVACAILIWFLAKERKPKSLPSWAAGVTGILSGLMAGSMGLGGPPLFFYYQIQGVTKSQFRNHLIAIFLILSLIRIPTYLLGGLFNKNNLLITFYMLPAALLGAWIGSYMHFAVNEISFKRYMALGLIILAILHLPRMAGM